MKPKGKISIHRRPYKAGEKLGNAIIETVHLLYLDLNALCYLKGLIDVLKKEFNRRHKEYYGRKK